jgi:nickel-dependent lactate racemase
MMEIRLPYGRTDLTAHIPDEIGVDFIEAPKYPAAADSLGAVNHALENLLGGVAWSDFAGSKSVAIAVNDKTRPVPHHQLLPPLLARLESLGIPQNAITLYVAVGTHPPMTPDEFPEILPKDIVQKYAVVSHNAEDEGSLIYLGKTPHGTPVWSNRDYVGSDLKIVLGNIEPHQFVGFSGGVKSAAVGLSGMATINHNHALMTHPDSQLGEYESNPARQDVEQIGEKIRVHLALNAILNHNREIVQVLAGEPAAVMRSGVPISRKVCQVSVSKDYGLVIASPGGYPKDINVYQTQKGLAHAVRVTRPGGTIIIAAACVEGSGNQHYEEWVVGKTSYNEIIAKFQAQGFRIGPHKAYQIARDATRNRLLFCSELDEDFAKALLLNPVKDLQTAVDMALEDLQPGEHVGVLPHAASTIPYLVHNKD